MLGIFQGHKVAELPGWVAARARAVAVAIAVVALAALLLRPFCDLASRAAVDGGAATTLAAIGHAVAGHSHSAPAGPETTCCATIANDLQLLPAEPLIAWLPGASLGTTFFIVVAMLPLANSRQAAKIRIASPPERSFYTRSTRILR